MYPTELKASVIRVLAEVKRTHGNKWNVNEETEMYKNVPNRNQGAEEYNN